MMISFGRNPDDLTRREEQELEHGKETPDEQYRRLCREWTERKRRAVLAVSEGR